MLKFRELEKEEIEGRKEDVYSKSYVPKKYSKFSAEYGTPKPGTLTEMRAKKASKHIAREMLYLCEVILEYGRFTKEGRMEITFGKLFSVYQFISDKVVGILLRARKHHMVDFDGEMLYQRRDEDVIITLLLSDEELNRELPDIYIPQNIMKNAYCEDGGVQLESSQIVETSSYVYLERSMNMENDLKEELNRRMRAACAAFTAVKEATDQLTDQDLCAHLFDSTVLPALCYAAET
ncbi:hypothetical protein RB195_006487 [Necator americanus]